MQDTIKNVCVVLLYFVTGYLANALLTIEGYPAAAWPPAGIALGAALLCGWRILPGILIGALLVNFQHLENFSDLYTQPIGLQALWISLAATAQAFVGKWLAEKVLQEPVNLLSIKHHLVILSLGGPLACLIASLNGSAALVFGDVIPSAAFANTAFQWWVGDTIGVLVFTPLVLAFGLYQNTQHKVQVLIPGFMLYLLTSIGLHFFVNAKLDRIKEQQQIKSQVIRDGFVSQFAKTETNIGLLHAFFVNSQAVSRDEFIDFTAKQLTFHDELYALEWIPKVPASQRAALEQQAQQDGYLSFKFKDAIGQGDDVTAGKRDVYYPIYYINADTINEAVLGYDIGVSPTRLAALNKAALTGKGVTSAPIVLVQSTDGSKSVFYTLAVKRDNQVLGFVMGVIHMPRLIDMAFSQAIAQSYSVKIMDVSDEEPQLLFDGSSDNQRQVFAQRLTFGDRDWQLTIWHDPLATDWSGFWFAQIITMLFVWLLITLLITLTGIQIRVSQQVEIQTKELREEKRKADDANRIKGEFLANMSHEVRTPINGIKGLHFLALNELDWLKAKDYIRQSDGALALLERVLNDVLDYSKMEANKLELEYSRFSLNQLVDELTGMINVTAESKDLSFIVQMPGPGDITLNTDAIRLKQILLNLLNNAVKFTRKGQVILSMRLIDSDIEFKVTDTGIGMDAQTQAQLFQPFSQADSSTSRQFGGTGLGLSICKRLVGLLGGDISVQSELGKGATFSVRIPNVASKVSLDCHTPKAVERQDDFSQLAILLVEDNPLNQHVAKSMLERAGCTPDVANDGFEAVSKVQSKHYDLVLMDIQMPGMDGLTATKKIRELGFEDLPILGLSANALEDDLSAARAAGMNDYVVKPIDIGKLFSAIVTHTS